MRPTAHNHARIEKLRCSSPGHGLKGARTYLGLYNTTIQSMTIAIMLPDSLVVTDGIATAHYKLDMVWSVTWKLWYCTGLPCLALALVGMLADSIAIHRGATRKGVLLHVLQPASVMPGFQ